MVKLAIRDDDVNFFTKVDDLRALYKDFGSFPVSFAVIPRVQDISTKGACPETRGNKEPKDVLENCELVSWLKSRLKSGACDVLMHGINHSYMFSDNGRRQAEMQWRDKESTLSELLNYEKERLSSAFDYQITCFVAPSNKITRYCLKQVVNAGMNFSGIVPINPNVNITIKNMLNYAKRWIIRAIYRLPYPGVLKYDNHKEVNACSLQSYEYLVRMFDFCSQHDLPMVINVHYWHLRDNPPELEKLRKFILDYAIPRGAIPMRLSDILDS